METAEAVIIGGGVVGASIAYHMAKKGCSQVVLLEKNPMLGMESTGACVGGIRYQFSTEINVRLSLLSRPRFLQFEEELGCDIGYRQHGYLFLATTPQKLEDLKDQVSLQRGLGVPTELLSRSEISERVPMADLRDVLGGAYCPWDGSADPYQVTQGYAQGAKRLGAKIFTDREATGILLHHGAVQGVLTPRGRIATPIVVDVAGPFGALVGELAGIKLPMAPFRRQVFLAQPPEEYPPGLPLVVDTQTEFYFKQEKEGFLLCRNLHEPSSFNKTLDWSSLDAVVEEALRWLPSFQEAQIIGGWAGLRSLTPDHHAILGAIPAVTGFFCAIGFSGHGFMHSPATGQLVAELILEGRASSVDISPLDCRRFEMSRLSQETQVF
ncbi:MAG: FAD-binding oxidoreductase [Nitrospinae bacterium]|nr:FAD-binding oxidoreductase [Nitrospinota bacterium]